MLGHVLSAPKLSNSKKDGVGACVYYVIVHTILPPSPVILWIVLGVSQGFRLNFG